MGQDSFVNQLQRVGTGVPGLASSLAKPQGALVLDSGSFTVTDEPGTIATGAKGESITGLSRVKAQPTARTITTTDAGAWHSVPGSTLALPTGTDAIVDLLFYASITSGANSGQTYGALLKLVVRNTGGTPTNGGGSYVRGVPLWTYDETSALITFGAVRFIYTANLAQTQVEGPAGPQDINWTVWLTPWLATE